MAKKKESRQKKINVRVDFTPMVDMMILHALYLFGKATDNGIEYAK